MHPEDAMYVGELGCILHGTPDLLSERWRKTPTTQSGSPGLRIVYRISLSSLRNWCSVSLRMLYNTAEVAMRKYKQVSEALRGRITDGKLGVGANTPTVRALSEQFSVSLLTAHQALKELVAQGLIEAQPGHGYRVIRAQPLREPPRPKALKGSLRTYSLYDL
jgi:DNA-binding transcriptional regulator YhcF (GntR family)